MTANHSSTIDEFTSGPIDTHFKNGISTIEERPQHLLPLSYHPNPRSLKHGCRHLMKHVETDHRQRQEKLAQLPPAKASSFTPKDLSVLNR